MLYRSNSTCYTGALQLNKTHLGSCMIADIPLRPHSWHSAISAKDEEWLNMTIRRFTNTPFDQMTEEDFYKVYGGLSKEQGECTGAAAAL